MDHQPTRVLRDQALGLRRWVVACALLDDDERLPGLGQNRRQKVTLAGGGKALGAALEEHAPAEVLDPAPARVPFSLAGCFDPRWLPAPGPGGAQRAPRGEAGFGCQQQPGATVAGRSQNRRPRRHPPRPPPFLLQLVRHNARLLGRAAQLTPHRAEGVHVVGAPDLTLNHILAQRTMPTPAGLGRGFRTSQHQRLQVGARGGSQLGRAPRRGTSDPARPALDQQGRPPGLAGFGTEPQAARAGWDRATSGQQQQRTQARDQPERTTAPRPLQAVGQLLDRRPSKRYG